MIVPLLALLAGAPPPQAQPAPAPTNYVVSILSEVAGDDFSVRFVLSGPPTTYSSMRDGDDIVVRIAAERLPGLSMPTPSGPIKGLTLGEGPGFMVRIALSEFLEQEMVRESTSLRLVLRKRLAEAIATPTPAVVLEAVATPSPSPEPTPERVTDPVAANTADLYARLFPSTTDPSSIAAPGGATSADTSTPENWFSDHRLLGLQIKPWISVSYMDGETTQVQAKTTSGDSYWVIQPNIGVGFSPNLGSAREGQWRVNYSPRFRRQLELDLPRLGSHFVDAGIDQPVASFGAVYGTYHFSKGVLETDEIDGGREYGIGLNRVLDSGLERFRRHSFGFGARFDFVADTLVDVNVGKTRVRYGNDPGEPRVGDRAFFDYDTRTLNASLRRELPAGRQLGLVFGIHDTPTQTERRQVEGRGYSYGLSLDGEIAVLTRGRIQVGYRTQKNPNAGEGGRDYKDITYAAQLAREITESTSLGIGADRKLYLSAYKDNGFYIADAVRADLSTRLPLSLFLRGNFTLQRNDYKASPQFSVATNTFVLRRDNLRSWSVGLNRNLRDWAFLRFDYTAERRDSNLDAFDITSRSLTFQLGLGFFGKPGRQGAPSW